ncbi:MAG: hypothetical protein KJ709_00145 [Nanoarchaeota archaeon]|nr:hypothetical protein [Nanoarchaeota archaeon]
MEKGLFITAAIMVMLAGCVSPAVDWQAGTIRECEFTMGEDNCGKCFCLETDEKGCEIIDFSDVGDLSDAVGKQVTYNGTRDQDIIQSTRMCPKYVKLYELRVIT